MSFKSITKRIIYSKEALAIVLLLFVIFIIKLLFLNQIAPNAWEPDEFQHFLQIRTVFKDIPQNLTIGLDAWAKPGYVYFYGIIVSLFNITELKTLQIVGILVNTLTAIAIYLSLRKLKINIYIRFFSIFLTTFSFLMFRGSFSILTESLFAMFLSVGFLLELYKRNKWATLIFGLLPLIRIEGFLVLIILIIVRYSKTWYWIKNIIALLIPTTIWSYLYYMFVHPSIPFLQNIYTSNHYNYGSGPWEYYIEGLTLIEPIFFLLCIAASILLIYKMQKNRILICSLLFGFWSFFLAQTIFWKFGLLGSAGLLRYFIVSIPIGVIIICLGLNKVKISDSKKRLLIFILSISLVFITLFTYIKGGRYHFQILDKFESKTSLEIGNYIKEKYPKSTYLVSDLPDVIYFADRDLTNAYNIEVDRVLSYKIPGIYAVYKFFSREPAFFTKLNSFGEVKEFEEFLLLEIK